jgi:hypothetical protein
MGRSDLTCSALLAFLAAGVAYLYISRGGSGNGASGWALLHSSLDIYAG